MVLVHLYLVEVVWVFEVSVGNGDLLMKLNDIERALNAWWQGNETLKSIVYQLVVSSAEHSVEEILRLIDDSLKESLQREVNQAPLNEEEWSQFKIVFSVSNLPGYDPVEAEKEAICKYRKGIEVLRQYGLS